MFYVIAQYLLLLFITLNSVTISSTTTRQTKTITLRTMKTLSPRTYLCAVCTLCLWCVFREALHDADSGPEPAALRTPRPLTRRSSHPDVFLADNSEQGRFWRTQFLKTAARVSNSSLSPGPNPAGLNLGPTHLTQVKSGDEKSFVDH